MVMVDFTMKHIFKINVFQQFRKWLPSYQWAKHICFYLLYEAIYLFLSHKFHKKFLTLYFTISFLTSTTTTRGLLKRSWEDLGFTEALIGDKLAAANTTMDCASGTIEQRSWTPNMDHLRSTSPSSLLTIRGLDGYPHHKFGWMVSLVSNFFLFPFPPQPPFIAIEGPASCLFARFVLLSNWELIYNM